MAEAAKKKAYIVKSFKDAGTGESFTAGATPLISPGAFENYKAAGLVRAPDAPVGAPKPKAKASPKKKAAAKRKPAPKAKPAPVSAPADNASKPEAAAALTPEDHAPSA